MFEDGILKIVDENGNEKEFSVLFTFDIEETKKSYVVYTDYSKSEESNIKVFASSYDKNDSTGKLNPVETKEELEVIDNLLEEIETDIRLNAKEGE